MDLPLLQHELWPSEATAMFSVIFEVLPKQEKFDLYPFEDWLQA